MAADQRPNKGGPKFFTENVGRNGLESHIFFGQKIAAFCCKSANLPNRTCFTRVHPPPKNSLNPFAVHFGGVLGLFSYSFLGQKAKFSTSSGGGGGGGTAALGGRHGSQITQGVKMETVLVCLAGRESYFPDIAPETPQHFPAP